MECRGGVWPNSSPIMRHALMSCSINTMNLSSCNRNSSENYVKEAFLEYIYRDGEIRNFYFKGGGDTLLPMISPSTGTNDKNCFYSLGNARCSRFNSV